MLRNNQWYCVVIDEPVPDSGNNGNLELTGTIFDASNTKMYITLTDSSTGACYVTGGASYEPDANNDVFYTATQQINGIPQTIRHWAPKYTTGVTTDANGQTYPYDIYNTKCELTSADLDDPDYAKMYISLYQENTDGTYSKKTDSNGPRLTYNGHTVDYINVRKNPQPSNMYWASQLAMSQNKKPYKYRGIVKPNSDNDGYVDENQSGTWYYYDDSLAQSYTKFTSDTTEISVQFLYSPNYQSCVDTGGDICVNTRSNFTTICKFPYVPKSDFVESLNFDSDTCVCPAGTTNQGDWRCVSVPECAVDGEKTNDCACPANTHLTYITGSVEQYCYAEETYNKYSKCIDKNKGKWDLTTKQCVCDPSNGTIPTEDGLSCQCDTANGWVDEGSSTCIKHHLHCSALSYTPEDISRCLAGERAGCTAANVPETNQKTCVSTVSYPSDLSYADTCTQSGGVIRTDTEGYAVCDCSVVDMNKDGVYDSVELNPFTGECKQYTFEEWCTNDNTEAHLPGVYNTGSGVCAIDHVTGSSGKLFAAGYRHLTWLIPNTDTDKQQCLDQGGTLYQATKTKSDSTYHLYNFNTCTCSGHYTAHSFAERDANGNCKCDATFVRDKNDPKQCICPANSHLRNATSSQTNRWVNANIYSGALAGTELDDYLGTNTLPIHWYMNNTLVRDNNGAPIDLECVLSKDSDGEYYCSNSCMSDDTHRRICAAFGGGQYNAETNTCECSTFGFDNTTDIGIPYCACALVKGFVSDGKGGCKCDKNTEYNADVDACVPIGSVCDAELSKTLSNNHVACKCDTARGYKLTGTHGMTEIDANDGEYIDYGTCQDACNSNPNRYVCGCEHGVSEYDENLDMYRCVQWPYNNEKRLECVMQGGAYVGRLADQTQCTSNMADDSGCHYTCSCEGIGQTYTADGGCTCDTEDHFVLNENWLTDSEEIARLQKDTNGGASQSKFANSMCQCADGYGMTETSGYMDISGHVYQNGYMCLTDVSAYYKNNCVNTGGTWDDDGPDGRKCTCTQDGTVHAKDVFKDGHDICLHWNAINCEHDTSKINTTVLGSWVDTIQLAYGYLCNASRCDMVREHLMEAWGDAYTDDNKATGWNYEKCKSGEQRCFHKNALSDIDGNYVGADPCLFDEIELIPPSQ